MNDLYNHYASTPGWWNQDGFSVDKFFGLMIMYEMGPNTDAQHYVIQAAALQIWGHIQGDGTPAPYCTGTVCVNGMFNFLAAYSESAQRRYDTVFRGIPSDFNSSDYPYTPGVSPVDWTSEKAIDHYNATAANIGSAILNVNVDSYLRIYTNDKPYHWGDYDGDYPAIYHAGTFYVLSANQRALINGMPIVIP